MPPEDDFADAPSPFTAQSVYPATPGATNPALAKEFLDIHRGEMAKRTPEIEGALGGMQLNVDSMTKILDETTAAIKAARTGRSNLPLMAMGAGLLSGTGNFGQQLGVGLGSMVPAIAHQRKEDESTDLQLAQLAMRKSMLQQAPLEHKLAYMKAMQTGDQGAVRAIEQSLIRSQAGAPGAADKAAQASAKLKADIVAKGISEARHQVDTMAKEMDWTADEREAEVQRRARQNVKAAAGLSQVDIKDTDINAVLGANAADPSKATKTLKSFFDSPNSEEAQKLTRERGLPSVPAGYVYDMVGRKERPEILKTEIANFNKESKDWDTHSKLATDSLAQLGLAENLLNKNPKITGPHSIGPIPYPNRWEFNKSPDARSLDSIFTGMQLHNVPQGQGAWSEMERRLMTQASPSMDNDIETNKRLIGLQKEMFKRDAERRDFFSEYFNHYKSMNNGDMVRAWDRYISSPAGTVISRDGAGNPVPNSSRMNWREYFRKERGPAGPEVPQGRAEGGAIKLGPEYDG